MSKNVNLKEIERQAFLSYHQDGLLDIMLGIILIPLGIVMLVAF